MTATIAEGARKRLRLTHALVGPSSYRLDARPQDHGASWPAIRWRCRHALPSELAWAAPLLRGEPEPVMCGQEQAEALFRRLDSLPTIYGLRATEVDVDANGSSEYPVTVTLPAHHS